MVILIGRPNFCCMFGISRWIIFGNNFLGNKTTKSKQNNKIRVLTYPLQYRDSEGVLAKMWVLTDNGFSAICFISQIAISNTTVYAIRYANKSVLQLPIAASKYQIQVSRWPYRKDWSHINCSAFLSSLLVFCVQLRSIVLKVWA